MCHAVTSYLHYATDYNIIINTSDIQCVVAYTRGVNETLA